MISTKQADANAAWEKTVTAPKEFGLKTDEAKSHCSREWRTEWEHETLQHKENLVVLGTVATERNPKMVDESDTTMAEERLNEAIQLAEHVEKIKRPQDGHEITSKSIARARDLDTREVKLGVLAPMTVALESKTFGTY